MLLECHDILSSIILEFNFVGPNWLLLSVHGLFFYFQCPQQITFRIFEGNRARTLRTSINVDSTGSILISTQLKRAECLFARVFIISLSGSTRQT